VASWSIQLFGHNRHGWKIVEGAVPFFLRGELGLHLTQCGLGRELPPYQVASWSLQPFDHTRHGPKKWQLLCPLIKLCCIDFSITLFKIHVSCNLIIKPLYHLPNLCWWKKQHYVGCKKSIFVNLCPWNIRTLKVTLKLLSSMQSRSKPMLYLAQIQFIIDTASLVHLWAKCCQHLPLTGVRST